MLEIVSNADSGAASVECVFSPRCGDKGEPGSGKSATFSWDITFGRVPVHRRRERLRQRIQHARTRPCRKPANSHRHSRRWRPDNCANDPGYGNRFCHSASDRRQRRSPQIRECGGRASACHAGRANKCDGSKGCGAGRDLSVAWRRRGVPRGCSQIRDDPGISRRRTGHAGLSRCGMPNT